MNGISLMMSKSCCPPVPYMISVQAIIDLFPRRLSCLHLQTTPLLATTRMLKHQHRVYSYSSSTGNDYVTGSTSVSATVVPYRVLRLGLIGLALIKACNVVAEFISTREGIERILKSNPWYSSFIAVAIGLVAKDVFNFIVDWLSLEFWPPSANSVIANKTPNGWRYRMVSDICFKLNEFKKIPEIINEIKNMMESNTNVLVEVEQPYCHLPRVKGFFRISIRCKLKHMSKDKFVLVKEDIQEQAEQITRKHGGKSVIWFSLDEVF